MLKVKKGQLQQIYSGSSHLFKVHTLKRCVRDKSQLNLITRFTTSCTTTECVYAHPERMCVRSYNIFLWPMQVSTYDTSQICKLITARGNLSSRRSARAAPWPAPATAHQRFSSHLESAREGGKNSRGKNKSRG